MNRTAKKILRILIYLVVSIFVLLFVTWIFGEEILTQIDLPWTPVCEFIRDDYYAGFPLINNEFQPFEPGLRDPKLPTMDMEMDGFRITLPKSEYRIETQEGENKEETTFRLYGNDHNLILGYGPIDRSKWLSLPESWFKLIIGGFLLLDVDELEERLRKADKNEIRRIFNHDHPSRHELQIIGFSHKPSDIECTLESRDRDIRIFSGLITKIFTPGDEFFFNIHGMNDITLLLNQTKVIWETSISTGHKDFFVSCYFDKRQPCESLLHNIKISKCKGECHSIDIELH